MQTDKKITVKFLYLDCANYNGRSLERLTQCVESKNILAHHIADFDSQSWEPGDNREVSLNYWTQEMKKNPPKESTNELEALNDFVNGFEMTEGFIN